MEEQRIRRVKRRQTRRRRHTVGVLGGIIRSVIVVGMAAILMATIFTWWTPTKFLNDNVRQELSVALATSAVTLQPTGLPTPNWFRKIGIVSGHRGPNNDPGAVCDDGLTEAATVFNIAQLVVRNLRGRGYTVDLLDEFDSRLNDYQAAALVSIHANTCKDWGETVSGFLIASAAARVTEQANDSALVECIARHYQQVSGLQRRNDGVTSDMSDYHTFREINALTPAAIIETGFLRADRDILTQKPDVLARGITDGIICFLEPATEPPTTPAPG
jgi:N-acetylmuramoyl-L-alanine amidase